MAPSYNRICKKLLQQKQSADKRNAMLHVKVSNLENKYVELELLKTKYDELVRENFYLDLEVKGLKKSQDSTARKNLETKSKFELVNQILSLMSQVAVLETTNTELWIDKRRLVREVDRLKLSPLSKICCEPTDFKFYPDAKPANDNEEQLSSLLVCLEDTPWTHFDDTVINAEDTAIDQGAEGKKFATGERVDPPILFSTPVKNLKVDGKSSGLLGQKNWLPTPPVAVIPPWCILSSDDGTLTPDNTSMNVSTTITDGGGEETIPTSSRTSPNNNRSIDLSTIVSDESGDDTIASSSRTCSTTYKQIKEGSDE